MMTNRSLPCTTAQVCLASFLAVALALGCGSDDEPAASTGSPQPRCNPSDPSYEPTGCECDPNDPTTCPSDFVCRPSGDTAVCQPEVAAGRIPSCLDPEGIDAFAAEANAALSVTWKVNGDIDFSGDGGDSFGSPQQLSGALVEATAPHVAIDPLTGDVFVAWQAREGAGDFNVYAANSADSGISFGGPFAWTMMRKVRTRRTYPSP
jgi:hypothetical protein